MNEKKKEVILKSVATAGLLGLMLIFAAAIFHALGLGIAENICGFSGLGCWVIACLLIIPLVWLD